MFPHGSYASILETLDEPQHRQWARGNIAAPIFKKWVAELRAALRDAGCNDAKRACLLGITRAKIASWEASDSPYLERFAIVQFVNASGMDVRSLWQIPLADRREIASYIEALGWFPDPTRYASFLSNAPASFTGDDDGPVCASALHMRHEICCRSLKLWINFSEEERDFWCRAASRQAAFMEEAVDEKSAVAFRESHKQLHLAFVVNRSDAALVAPVYDFTIAKHFTRIQGDSDALRAVVASHRELITVIRNTKTLDDVHRTIEWARNRHDARERILLSTG